MCIITNNSTNFIPDSSTICTYITTDWFPHQQPHHNSYKKSHDGSECGTKFQSDVCSHCRSNGHSNRSTLAVTEFITD